MLVGEILVIGWNVDKVVFVSFWGMVDVFGLNYINLDNVFLKLNGGEIYLVIDGGGVVWDGFLLIVGSYYNY